MKAIFDAIRAAKELRKTDAGYSLREFESANRGHSHLLDELALESTTRPRNWFNPDPRHRARLSRLEDSTTSLLDSLTRYLPDSALTAPEWDAILDAPDSTQFLARRFNAILERWSWLDLARQTGQYRLASLQGHLKAGTLELRLELTAGRRGELKAERTLQLQGHRLDTLRGYLRAFKSATLAIAALLKDPKNFPEFSEEAQQSQFETALRRKFARAMETGFDNEERTWLRQHLSGIRF